MNPRDQLNFPRVVGLDSLRAIMALVVFMFHDAAPPLMLGYDSTSSFLRKLNVLFNWSFNGQMAVVVFFLISGFCIHYPYTTRRLQPAAFYTNRALRLTLPAVAAIALTWVFKFRQTFQLNGVPIRSLWCELTYYLFYPFFLILIRQGRLNLLLVMSYGLAFTILGLSPAHDRYHEYGYLSTTAIGLPVWLLGAYFAEHASKYRPKQNLTLCVWIYRAIMVVLCCATLTASSRHLLGLGWSLTLASPFLFFWIREETTYFAAVPPPQFLERIGKFSYSIYLLHLMILFSLSKLMINRLGGNIAWCIKVTCVLGISYLFYLIVEAPSHRLSRQLGEFVSKRTSRMPFYI